MNLGELIDALKKTDPNHYIRVPAPVNLVPRSVASYRGYYEDLAIGVECDRGGSVREFLEELEAAVGKVFIGYKGGDFQMNRNTRVWISNYGECSSALVTGVRTLDWGCVEILYKMEDD